MINEIEVEEFYKNKNEYLIIDVRSPVEFEKGFIPDAHNIPLFTNEERKKIGILYKENPNNAVKLAIKFVSPKLVEFIEQVESLSKSYNKNKFVIYCWRGGKRSESFTQLLTVVGINAHKIIGGYKRYRNENREILSNKAKVVILSGFTGSGKTEILAHLKKMGVQTIDLESIANHKGSAFGTFGEKPQPTNEHFENLLAEQWRNIDRNKIVWLEDESHAIGKIRIPDVMFLKMRNTKVIKILVDRENRLERLEKMYTHFPKNKIIETVRKISKKIGTKNCKIIENYINSNNYKEAIEIVIDYYDKTYSYGINKRNPESIININCYDWNSQKIAEYIANLDITVDKI